MTSLFPEPPSPPSTVSSSALLTLTEARKAFDRFPLRRPHPDSHRNLTHGWMLPTLLLLDDWLWKRWDYWRICCENPGALPQELIPSLTFLDMPHDQTRKMIEASLDCIPQHGSWQTWGGWGYFDYFLSWLLFGFGHRGHPELPTEPAGCQGASDRLYQVFCLDALLLWPHDYLGDLLAHSSYGKRQGFYPTPHSLCNFIVQAMMSEGQDYRRETVCDPCVGTGRFLLYASNHSLRLYGMDIDATLCKATLVNAYCYAPWLAKPIPWLNGELAFLERFAPQDEACELKLAAELSDAMIIHAEPSSRSARCPTEHDASGQKRVAPLLKRRRQTAVDSAPCTLFGSERKTES